MSDRLVRMYRQMLAIRLFEERVNDLYMRALMPGLAHLYIGEEAVAVGVCETLRRDDYITSTHRGHGHCLAKGAAPDRMFAELLGKKAGYCKGKGGSMHIADPETGNLGANAIVAGSAALATGAAFSSKYLNQDRVVVCFFGEGALGQGILYESMNLAQLWKLPVVYLCENNLYNEYTHFTETTAGDISRDYYRAKQEEQRWMAERDPITMLGSHLVEEGGADRAALDRIRDELTTEMDQAMRWAVDAPYPPADDVAEDVYAAG